MGLHELKPCPFCGGEAGKHIDDYGEGKFYVTVRCSKCGAKVFREGAIETVTEEAVNAWNRRADEVKGGFDGTEWERLLLLFLLSFTDPPRREITVRAESGGKTVNISYDPHDPVSGQGGGGVAQGVVCRRGATQNGCACCGQGRGQRDV